MAVTLSAPAGGLPELGAVPWRERASDRTLRRAARRWTLCTAAHTVPLVATAGVLAGLDPVTIPVGLILLGHAWAIPELYAARGAKVVRSRGPQDCRAEAVALGAEAVALGAEAVALGAEAVALGAEAVALGAEAVALGFLGDLLDHRGREFVERTGLVLEASSLGVWLLAPSGALLVRPGGRRVHSYCVGVKDPRLPPSDRTAHLLLALREDETGLATLANLAFSGAPWRLRRRLKEPARSALDEAVRHARRLPPPP